MKQPMHGRWILALVVLLGCGPAAEPDRPKADEAHEHDHHAESAAHEHDHHADSATHVHDEAGSDHGHGHERGAAHDHGAEAEGASWAVTAFGEGYEIFAEADLLEVGTASRSHTHVTVLEGFGALTEGRVEAVLIGPDGTMQRFVQETAVRPGIFDIALTPREEGIYALSFQVDGPAGREVIPAGSVRVGSAEDPGSLDVAVFDPLADGDGVSFLKEQQWQTTFATTWVTVGALADSIRGSAAVRPVAGGEVVLTAPIDGVLAPPGTKAWPHAGAEIASGARLFAVVPRRNDAVTPAALEAGIRGLVARGEAARARLERLEKLYAVEAASLREVEAQRAELVGLEADLEGRRRDLASEMAARRAGAGGAQGAVAVTAPFTSVIADVRVSPGEAVAAGAPLARLIRRGPVWLEVRLTPAAAFRLDGAPSGLLLHLGGVDRPITLEAGTLRPVARLPEVDASSGTIGVILEVDAPPPTLISGLRAEAQILLPQTRDGIVVPRSAVIDDHGIDVVYVQMDGETFARREIEVLARQGDRLLVSGVSPGERLVTEGGAAIRRADLLAAGGGGHGHAH